jgi:N-ethylmaleimide reductase
MYTDEQEEGWAKVVNAVHDKGGTIVLQLWHMGRAAHPDLQDGQLPVAPSAIAIKGEAYTFEGKKPYVTPRALEASELPGIVQDYVQAARRALRAGFDGVEVHAANGYLLDEFIRDGSNTRSDAYGGSIENRLRFPLEVTRAVIAEAGASRTGIRLSPQNPYNDMSDSDPVRTFTAAAKALEPLNLAYLHVMEPIKAGPRSNLSADYVTPDIRKVYSGNIIVNGGYDAQSGEDALVTHPAQAVAYGVPFLANPDLVERFRTGAALNEPRQDSFYLGGAEGYTDYPFLSGSRSAA